MIIMIDRKDIIDLIQINSKLIKALITYLNADESQFDKFGQGILSFKSKNIYKKLIKRAIISNDYSKDTYY